MNNNNYHYSSFLRIGAVSAAVLVFWVTRICYWSVTFEEPFSDMSNYHSVSVNVLNSLDFSWDSFWRSMNVPTLVSFRAIQMYLFGESLQAWRFFQTVFLFCALLWLCYELYKVVQVHWIPVILLWMVALSKSSIFWSYKLSRESIGEGFIYLCIATTLFALRQKSNVSFFFTGITIATCFLNKSNFVVVLPLIAILVLCLRESGFPLRKRITALTCLLLGVILLWGPWIIRSYRLYGHPVVLSTQGGIAFFWELGLIESSYNGKSLRIHSDYFFEDAPKVFKNDCEADQFLKSEMVRWLQANWRAYFFNVIPRRIFFMIENRDEYLTRVSRTSLYSGQSKLINLILIDKMGLLVVTGALGLTLWPILVSGRLTIMPLVILAPLLSSLAVLGYPRMLDSALPSILFGNTVWFYLFYKRGRVSEIN